MFYRYNYSVCMSACVCPRTDPDGGLVRPEGVLFTDPAEELLEDGIPRAKNIFIK